VSARDVHRQSRIDSDGYGRKPALIQCLGLRSRYGGENAALLGNQRQRDGGGNGVSHDETKVSSSSGKGHQHTYEIALQWQGNRGTGTSGYRSYGREHVISAQNKADISGSADRAFHGDTDRWNPEEMLLAALSQCHLLSYLHVAASHGVVVTAYTDAATGVMEQTANGGGHFISAVLRPIVTIDGGGSADEQLELAQSLHEEASEKCFIAASVNFPVLHEPIAVLS
jgi:organic hydroperoxide reductase OsmC/OhrA